MVYDIILRQLSDKYIYIVMIVGSLYLCLLALNSIAVNVTRFEKSYLPRTQHQDTLFTIKR